MKRAIILLAGIFYLGYVSAQITPIRDSSAELKPDRPLMINSNNPHAPVAISPYKTGFVKDGITIAATVGATLVGYSLIKNKHDLTMAELATKTKSSLPFFDRFAAGNYSTQANKDSYILFDGSYAIPVVAALINGKERSKFGQIMVMYLETMGITGAMYTLTAGLVYRSRPFVYGDKAPLEKRLDKGGQRSFYGGHVATTAAATFLRRKFSRILIPVPGLHLTCIPVPVHLQF